jgi:hypothetical protein
MVSICPAWYFVHLNRRANTPDEKPSSSLDRELTTNIVAAYVFGETKLGRTNCRS